MLIVDLDDSFLKTDLLLEGILTLIKKNPLYILCLPFWALQGPLVLKTKVAARIRFTGEHLPVHNDVVEVIKDRLQNSEKVLLISASPQVWVETVAARYPYFTKAVGSTTQNLKGFKKAEYILSTFPNEPFSYVGDTLSDLAVWKHAQEAIVVNPSKGLLSQVQKLGRKVTVVNDRVSTLRMLIKQLRPHQWLKNFLLFLPLIVGHKLQDASVSLILAFASFSLAASSVYVFNDLLDLESDRLHHSKKNRPFAAGKLSLKWGLVLIPALVCAALLTGLSVNLSFFLWVCAYYGLNLLYTFKLKRILVIDIVVLSAMYTLRLFAGAAASETPISEWFLSFSTMFFFGLACVKRYTEIIRSNAKLNVTGRGYRQVDDQAILTLGSGAGLLSIVIFLIYLQSPAVLSLYHRPQLLWVLTPVLLYWTSRLWLLTSRNEVHDDPVIFAAKDKVSWVCFAVIALVMGAASL